MSHIFNSELLFQTMSLDSEHLSHAIELMRISIAPSKMTKPVMEHVFAHRFAISSIVHAFSGLESAINLFGFELFFNPDSQRFVPHKQRDFLLNRMIKSWDTAPSIDKLSFVLAHSGKLVLQPKLENQLRELNNLRNWIVHGFSYKKTYLVEPSSENPGAYNVVDIEDSVDWAKKFPNTKFKSLDRLDAYDAQLALRIIFSSLKLLSDCMDQPLGILTCIPDLKYTVLHGDSFNEKVEELIKLPLESDIDPAPNNSFNASGD
jgi:hypothetical protein